MRTPRPATSAPRPRRRSRAGHGRSRSTTTTRCRRGRSAHRSPAGIPRRGRSPGTRPQGAPGRRTGWSTFGTVIDYLRGSAYASGTDLAGRERVREAIQLRRRHAGRSPDAAANARRCAVGACTRPCARFPGVNTVRDEALETMRRLGLTTIFGNPGSTAISFLTELPRGHQLRAGAARGLGGRNRGRLRDRPGKAAFVNLHTAPGLGNAINAIANARDCRAPLVVVVGQQDRRQIAPSRSSPDASSSGWQASTRCGRAFRCVPRTCRSDRPRLPRGSGGLRFRRWWWCRWETGQSLPTSWPRARRRACCARGRSPPSRSTSWPH